VTDNDVYTIDEDRLDEIEHLAQQVADKLAWHERDALRFWRDDLPRLLDHYRATVILAREVEADDDE